MHQLHNECINFCDSHIFTMIKVFTLTHPYRRAIFQGWTKTSPLIDNNETPTIRDIFHIKLFFILTNKNKIQSVSFI